MRPIWVLLFLLLPHVVQAGAQARSLVEADPQMLAALAGLVPDLPDWHCTEPPSSPMLDAVAPYAPMAVRECQWGEVSLILMIAFDPDFAASNCTQIRRSAAAPAPGKSRPGRSYLQEGGWLVEAGAAGFKACLDNQVYTDASLLGAGTHSSTVNAALDRFRTALTSRDVTKIEQLGPESEKRLTETFAVLHERSLELDRLLPRPEGWTVSANTVEQMNMMEQAGVLDLPVLLRLMWGAFASLRLSRGDCSINLSLSAAPEALHETGAEFARLRLREGFTRFTKRDRVTARLRGQEAVDGSAYRFVLDEKVVMRVTALGDCSAEPGAAEALSNTIIGHDFSGFPQD
ncbi:hypothetical protein [Gemmobacter serpentinus]|uniref:hypothetical protein n=1 Tax=Gemmobacter serpentinus TaxID=2652247 RepID=UPI00124CAB04|nr:hypothetical protein [Gemmobacter serpentinus]